MRGRFHVMLALALASAPGCQTTVTPPKATKPSSGAKPSVAPGVKATPAPAGTTRIVAQTGAPTILTGRVQILSDQGGAILSNNGGAILANNGGGFISDQGGGFISDQGGGLVSNNGGSYRLQAVGGVAAIADVAIEVVDAAGRVLTDAAGKPLTATSDAKGFYKLEAVLPPENVVLRAKLAGAGSIPAGTLQALVAGQGAAGPLPVGLNTASSLAAGYVLDEYVKGDPAVLAKLPREAERALQRDMTAALSLLSAAPAYDAAALQAAAAQLRAGSPALDATLDRIQALLVAGQGNLGNGLPATRVALTKPAAVLVDPAGAVLVAESGGGRVRRIRADGVIELLAGGGTRSGNLTGVDPLAANFGILADLALDRAGALLIADTLKNQLYRVGADGKLALVAGDGDGGTNGSGKQGPVDVPAATTSFQGLTSLAVARDGTIYLGEVVRTAGGRGRILAIGADGVVKAVPTDDLIWGGAAVSGLACGPDGTLYAINGVTGNEALLRRKPGATAWELVANDLQLDQVSRVLAEPDGGLLITETDAHRLIRLAPDGTRTTLAGTGTAGFPADGAAAASAPLNRPAGLWRGPDGTLYVADLGNGLVYGIQGGKIRAVAGTVGSLVEGAATGIAISSPAGLARDPLGRLVLAELTSSTIKRLENGALTLVAGSVDGPPKDGPALAATFYAPSAIAYRGADLFIADSSNRVIRKLGADGQVTTVAGNGVRGDLNALTGAKVAANGPYFRRPQALAVGKDGLIYVADMENNQVVRLTNDGQLELVAGSLSPGSAPMVERGDGGPAAEGKLTFPAGLAFDTDGNLYIADGGNLAVRKVAYADGTGIITTIAGMGPLGLGKIGPDGSLPDEENKPALDALLTVPGSLAFDAAGDLYIGELGTTNLETFGALGGIALQGLPPLAGRVRKVSMGQPGRPIRTIAGQGGVTLTAPVGDDAIRTPLALLFDADKGLYVSDTRSNQIKLIPNAALAD